MLSFFLFQKVIACSSELKYNTEFENLTDRSFG